MTAQLHPYLNFGGNCKEAMEFYKGVFGGELRMHTFSEFGHGGDGIMHAKLESDEAVFLASDGPEGHTLTKGDNINLSLSGTDRDKLVGYWEALVEGGAVVMPFKKQVWGDEFGMLTDKFGMPWMVNVVADQA